MDAQHSGLPNRRLVWQYVAFVLLVIVLTIVVLAFLGPDIGEISTTYGNI